MIWTISTHYNTPDRISGLLRKISNEIIRRCQATVDLDLSFAGDVDKPAGQVSRRKHGGGKKTVKRAAGRCSS